MLIRDFTKLDEARRNPALNPKMSDVDFVRQYKDNPKAYLHTGPIQKVGIYPQSSSSHDSPVGIYAYRIMDIWEGDIERWNTGEYKRGLDFLAYRGGDHLFILESDIAPDFVTQYSEADLERDVEKLKAQYGLSDRRIAELRRTARTNLNFRDCPAGYLWGMTKALVARVDEFDEHTPVNTTTWNHVLRKLGYEGFNDSGYGVIHGAEGCQALFLTTGAFKVIDHMLNNRGQSEVRLPDGRKYVGGRLPRDLHLSGVGGVFMHNHAPEEFTSVRRWTVDGMDFNDLSRFTGFVAWNSVAVIKHLSVQNSEHLFGEGRNVAKALSKLSSNIEIECLGVGGRDPYRVLRDLPANIPVGEIVISQLADTYGFDRLPEQLLAKIRLRSLRGELLPYKARVAA